MVERLRGMWAFCIRDSRTGEIFLSRDPFGIKPLYLYNDGKTSAFSSEIKGLLALPQIKREMDIEAVQELLLLGYIVAPKTILKYARALLPGEELILNAAGKEKSRFVRRLDFDSSRADKPPSDDELLGVLEDSVRHHLIADVPVGLFFSGGLDSTVLAMMLQRIGARLKAYHVAVERRADTPFARSIAERLGLDFTEISFSPDDASAYVDRFWQAQDQPFADASFLPTLAVSKRAAKEVKVVLSGEGGDELFAGYNRHRRLGGLIGDIEKDKASRTEKSAQTLLRIFPSLASHLPKIRGVLRSSAYWMEDPAEAFIAETAIGSGVIGSQNARRAIHDRLGERERPDAGLALDRLIYLPDDLLAKIDVATMANSLEGRVPFLDREVFRLVGATPITWKRAEGVGKAPLRRLLKRALPADLIDRPKTGFSVPLSTYFLNQHDEIHEALTWYQKNYTGLAPTLDSLLAWGLARNEKMNELKSMSSYLLFAIYALWHFNNKNK